MVPQQVDRVEIHATKHLPQPRGVVVAEAPACNTFQLVESIDQRVLSQFKNLAGTARTVRNVFKRQRVCLRGFSRPKQEQAVRENFLR
jgi:hypothetical protein